MVLFGDSESIANIHLSSKVAFILGTVGFVHQAAMSSFGERFGKEIHLGNRVQGELNVGCGEQ